MELRELALRHATIVEALGDFSIVCDGGAWAGEIARTTVAEVSCPILAVRTFTQANVPVRGVAFAAVMER